MGTMAHYGIMFYFIWIHNNHPFFKKCIDNTDNIEQEIQSSSGYYIILSAIIIIIGGSGLFCDIKMLRFVKSQNKIQPTQLVPWKSISQKNVDDDQKVPLNATVISSMSLLFGLIAQILLQVFGITEDTNENHFWIPLEIIIIWGSLNMPFLLMLTIKHKKKSATVQSNQPPQKLQFHDEAIETDGISEPLQVHEEFVKEDCDKAATNQEVEIVEVHQESQNAEISHSGLNSTISIVEAMDQTKVPNPLEEYHNHQKRHNDQSLSDLNVPSGHEDLDKIVCVERVTIISD